MRVVMTSEYAEEIFKVFTRLHTRFDYVGSEVGLSIVRRVVENHKGYIYAEGELDRGSTFTVILPNKDG